MKTLLYCVCPGILTFLAVCAWDFWQCCGDTDQSAAFLYVLHALIIGGSLGVITSAVVTVIYMAIGFRKTK